MNYSGRRLRPDWGRLLLSSTMPLSWTALRRATSPGSWCRSRRSRMCSRGKSGLFRTPRGGPANAS